MAMSASVRGLIMDRIDVLKTEIEELQDQLDADMPVVRTAVKRRKRRKTGGNRNWALRHAKLTVKRRAVKTAAKPVKRRKWSMAQRRKFNATQAARKGAMAHPMAIETTADVHGHDVEQS